MVLPRRRARRRSSGVPRLLCRRPELHRPLQGLAVRGRAIGAAAAARPERRRIRLDSSAADASRDEDEARRALEVQDAAARDEVVPRRLRPDQRGVLATGGDACRASAEARSLFLMQRLESLDVFRGLTIAGMILVSTPGTWDTVYPELEHAAWNGWTLADLVFPFLLFAMGAAVPFALARRRGMRSVRRHVIRRATVLFVLGLLLNAIQAAPPLSLAT